METLVSASTGRLFSVMVCFGTTIRRKMILDGLKSSGLNQEVTVTDFINCFGNDLGVADPDFSEIKMVTVAEIDADFNEFE